MIMRIIVALICWVWISGCASTIAVKKGYDFSQIKKVAVLPFEGRGVSGSVVADDFIRQLLQLGVDVVEREHIEKLLKEQNLNSHIKNDISALQKTAKILGVDAFFTGTVSQYKHDQSFLVALGDSDGVIIERPVIKLNSSTYYRRENHLGEDSYVLSVGAIVSVSARLIDVQTATIIWADRETYEALETSHAVSSIVSYFLRSLKPYWKF